MSATQTHTNPRQQQLGYDGGLTCSLQVSDLTKAIEWYQQNLGFTLIYRVDEIGWAELASPVARVNLGLAQSEKVQHGGGVVPTFGVTSVDDAKKDLEGRGVKFDKIVEYPGMVKLATLYDLDGNSLMLYQDLAPKR